MCRVLNCGWNVAPGIQLTKLTAMPESDYHLAQADRHVAETKQLIALCKSHVGGGCSGLSQRGYDHEA
jgi:hypothetical protein